MPKHGGHWAGTKRVGHDRGGAEATMRTGCGVRRTRPQWIGLFSQVNMRITDRRPIGTPGVPSITAGPLTWADARLWD
jgi:hypothetical protein